MVFNLWLAAVVYHVYWTCKKFLTAQIPELGSFTYETTFIAIFVLIALNSGISDTITNILHVICTSSEIFFLYIWWGQCTVFHSSQSTFLYPCFSEQTVRRLFHYQFSPDTCTTLSNYVNLAWALSGNCKMFIRSWLLKIHFGKL